MRGLRRAEQSHDTWDVLDHEVDEYSLGVIPVSPHKRGPLHGLQAEVGQAMVHTPPAHILLQLRRRQRRRSLRSHTDTLGSGASYPDTPCAEIQLCRDQLHIHTGRLTYLLS